MIDEEYYYKITKPEDFEPLLKQINWKMGRNQVYWYVVDHEGKRTNMCLYDKYIEFKSDKICICLDYNDIEIEIKYQDFYTKPKYPDFIIYINKNENKKRYTFALLFNHNDLKVD